MMKLRKFVSSMLLPACALTLPVVTVQAKVYINPTLVTGAFTVDPPGEQTIDKIATGAVDQATLEAVGGIASIQDFTDWSPLGTPNYIVFTTDTRRPDVCATYSAISGASAGGATSDVALRSSPGASISIDSAVTVGGSLILDFGSATVSGTTVTGFATNGMAPTAVGFTVCGLLNTSNNVTIQYFSADDKVVLSTQQFLRGADPDTDDGSTHGADGYTSFQAAAGIGKVRIVVNSILAGTEIGIDDLTFNHHQGIVGQQIYMTRTGDGSRDGTYGNPYAITSLQAVLNSMPLGGTLYIGYDIYPLNTLFPANPSEYFQMTSSGTASQPKRIVGVPNAQGLYPEFQVNRYSPGNGGTNNETGPLVFKFAEGVDHWTIANLSISGCQYAVYGSRRLGTQIYPREGIILRNLDILNVRHGLFLSDCDFLTVENVSVVKYAKHAFRLEQGCNDVIIADSLADCSGGDTTWYGKPMSLPIGFVAEGVSDNFNSRILFLRCEAYNNRYNNQTRTYWNGDGFVVNKNNSSITYDSCISKNNEDAGFDSKPPSIFRDCVAIGNCHGFKVWNGLHQITNCVATFPQRRTSVATYVKEGDFVAASDFDADIRVKFFTGHGVETRGIIVEKDKVGGKVEVRDSIISLVNSTAYAAGAVTEIDTIRWPEDGDNPNFVRLDPAWNGYGNWMDSNRFGLETGYNSNR